MAGNKILRRNEQEVGRAAHTENMPLGALSRVDEIEGGAESSLGVECKIGKGSSISTHLTPLVMTRNGTQDPAIQHFF